MTPRLTPGFLLVFALGCGDLGPTPTEKVLASQKQEEILPYSDPYADGNRLAQEREALSGACEEARKKWPPSTPKRNSKKKDKEDIAALNESLAAACSKDTSDLQAFFEGFGDVAVKALNMANEFRGKSISVDLFTGKGDPVKAKNEAFMTAYADTFEAVGRMALDQVLAYLYYAPLPQRKLATDAAIGFYPRLPPDYEEEFIKQRLGKAWSMEGDETLKKTLCDQIYGKARCDAIQRGAAEQC